VLALDLQWCWSHSADELWKQIDPELWSLTRNPWVVIQTVSRTKLKALSEEPEFRQRLEALARRQQEHTQASAWYQNTHAHQPLSSVAYFSMEFMLSEALPTSEATKQHFYEQEKFNINDILDWHRKHEDESPWKQAAGVYVRILSQPQLYIEGNHRTGALIMSYILARYGQAPFVLTVDNAKAYFDPSTLVKDTKKTTATLLIKLPGMKKRFAQFLRDQANEQYLRSGPV
jgi:hypothetical protein